MKELVIIKFKALNKGFELIGETELLDRLLLDRGVTDPKHLLNVSISDVHDGMLFRNMGRGLKMLKWHIDNGSKIHIIADCDLDGFTSASEIYCYIKSIDPNAHITISTNEDKVHGIILENLEEFEYDMLIVPDAGSSDFSQTERLFYDQEKDILILDHHEMKSDNPCAVVINCQDGQYPNNTLSGSLVVYKFMKEFDKEYGYNFADDFIDLASVGAIADSMDLRDYETRYLCEKGLKNISNTFIKEFLAKNDVDTKAVNYKFVGWKIAPLINATTRVGTPEEKIDVIKAFLGVAETKDYQPRRKKKEDPKPPIEVQTIQKAMIRETTNIKARQDKLVTKGMEALVEIINSQQLFNDKVIIVDGTEALEKVFTGLVANKLADIYKRPIVILKEMKKFKSSDEPKYGGSFRNYDLFPVESMLELLEGTKLFEMVAGHHNAGGFRIKKALIPTLIEELNEVLKDVIPEDTYLVDYAIPVGRLKENQVLQVGRLKDVWGNTLKAPIFAITDISLNIEDIKLLGEKKNFIRIEKNVGNQKLVFTKMFASENIYNQMIMKNSKGLSTKAKTKVKMEIIGEFAVNEFNGNDYAQINIIDFNVLEDKEFRF